MGNICLQQEVAGGVLDGAGIPDSKHEDTTTHDAPDHVFVRVWERNTDPERGWMTDGLEKGSDITVGTSVEKQYFVWERSDGDGEPSWRIRADTTRDLYITYDESGNLTMEPYDESNSNFYVSWGPQGGYVFRAQSAEKFIAAEQGRLILSETPTEWLIAATFDMIANAPNILIITEVIGDKKWYCESNPKSDESVYLTEEYTDTINAQWLGNYILTKQAHHLKPRVDPSLSVTCEGKSNTVSLQKSEVSEMAINEVLLISDGNTLQNIDGSKYICSETEGDYDILSLTPEKRLASHWKVTVYGFDNSGIPRPPMTCGKKT